MANKYNPPSVAQCDAESPINEALMKDGYRDSIVGIGLPASVFNSFLGDGGGGVAPTSTGSLDCTSSGISYPSWTLPTGQTITLNTSGGIHRMGVQGTLKVVGDISADGTGAAGGVGAIGADGPQGTDSPMLLGGGAAASGASGNNSSYDGGDGGKCPGFDRSEGAPANGSVGTAGVAGTAAVASAGRWYGDMACIGPAPGGGAGSAGNAEAGGNGGNGGGAIIIECDVLDLDGEGTISANGAAGVQGASNAGGGGGGAGGTVIIISRTTTGSGAGPTLEANGGAGGVGHQNGGAGGAGRTALVVLQ